MSKRVRSRMLLSPLLFLGLLYLLIVPASACPTVMNVTLDKTYQYNDMSVRYLEVVDVADPAVSKAWMLETIPGDLKTIRSPSVRYLNRSFTTDRATVHGVTVRLTDRASLERPLSMAGVADYSVYTSLHVPTPHLEVSGGASGNPIIAKNNESYTPSSDSSISALFNASKFLYLYAPQAVVHYDPSTGQMTQVGTFSGSINSIGQTLVDNQVPLSSFSANAGNTASMSGVAATAPTPGKYALTATRYDSTGEKIYVLASLPVVIMDGDRSLTWNGQTTPAGITVGRASDATISFSNQAGVTDTAYLIVRKGATYDVAASVDVSTLATNAKDHWDSMGTSATIADLLVWGVTHEIGGSQPVTYAITAVGGAAPAPSTRWSDIAITPGYGCSGHANSAAATVPASALNTLGTGTYYVYAAGLNADHDIVALDQKEVTVSVAPTPTSSGGGGGGSYTPSEVVSPESGSTASSVYTTFTVPGATFATSGNAQTLSLDLSKAKRVKVAGDTITVEQNGLTYVIKTSGISRNGDIVTGTVTDVTVKCTPMTGTFDKVGGAAANFVAHFSSFPAGAHLSATLDEKPAEGVVSAYRFALRSGGLDVGDVAYTLTVKKTGIEATGPATITMAVDPAWVTAHGGVNEMRIVRQADDGTTEVLETVFKGYNADKQYVFEAQSPNGLSVIGLVAVTTATTGQTTTTTVPVGETTVQTGETPAPAGEGGFPLLPTLVILVVVVALAVVSYRMIRKQ
jgi:hypothetical protein